MRTILIDGNNLLYRCYYVVEVMNPGKPIGLLHLHMFLNSLKMYVEMYRPKTTIVCWDRRQDDAANIRNSIIPEYKANRDKSKSEVIHAYQDVLESLLTHMGVINFFPKAMEADDCIAYLCHTLPEEKVIVSVDKDLLQLISDDIVYYDPKKKVEINIHNFEEHAKISRGNFLVEKCMIGDKSDNISGLKGYGPVKIRRYFAGEVKLTEAEQTKLDLNLEMMDLNMYKKHPEEVAFYESQSLKGTPSWDDFEKVCTANGMQSIIRNKSAFYSLFFIENTLSNMFTNLFG